MGGMNAHLRDLLTGLEARYPDDSTTMSMSTWLERNTRLRKAPFSFHRYEFQRKIADDLHPNLNVMKPSQVGLSELQLRKFLGMLKRTTAITGIYTLPNEKMRDRISQTRIKPLVESETVFNGPTAEKPVRYKGLYQIDDSFGYVTGSTEGDATSIPADFLMHDEIDLTEDRMIGLSRLQGSTCNVACRSEVALGCTPKLQDSMCEGKSIVMDYTFHVTMLASIRVKGMTSVEADRKLRLALMAYEGKSGTIDDELGTLGSSRSRVILI